jgi:methionyl-tRNA formyltransferase
VRVVILTGSRFGSASHCLPALAEQPGVEVALVVHALGHYRSRWTKLRRDARKTLRIGPLGALVGRRMRSWYAGPPETDLAELARRYGIPFESSPRTNADETVELFRRSGAELGLSLGNSIIFPRVFEVPRLGMLNVHGEILPDFQGAASVVWPIYEGVPETGFSIHRIDRSIDTGPLLYVERRPIEFRATLRETVAHNVAETRRRVPPALARVVADFDGYLARARVQRGGRSYTTPTFRQFLRMRRQHERLRRGAAAAAGVG